jgi:hypothetical protein
MTVSLDSQVSAKARHNAGGRPPKTEAAIVFALQSHPELRGKPNDLARFIALSDPCYSRLTAAAVTSATARLKRRLGGKLDVSSVCADEEHIGSIVTAANGERSCLTCGRCFGYGRDDMWSNADQRAFVNPLHRVYEPQGLVYPRREGMISQAATTSVAYGGDDVTARLKHKALSGLAQLCKDVDRGLLPQDRTAELSRLVEEECETRGSYTKTATLDEAKNTVISALITMISTDPQRSAVYLRMVRAATVLFIDATKSLTKPTKHSLLDEEEAVEKKQAHEAEPFLRSGASQ